MNTVPGERLHETSVVAAQGGGAAHTPFSDPASLTSNCAAKSIIMNLNEKVVFQDESILCFVCSILGICQHGVGWGGNVVRVQVCEFGQFAL
jgi:hypothetical protein